MANYQTIYALSSGPLPSAISIIRASGPSVKNIFKLTSGRVPEPRKMTLVEIQNLKKEVIDISLVCFFPKEESITGEDLAEFHIHGSLAVMDELLLTLSSITDVRPAEPGEFTRRSLYNGKMGLTEVEALGDLISSETSEQRKQSLRQMKGDLSNKYGAWRKELILIRAEIEAMLDFSDETDVNDNANTLIYDKNILKLLKKINQDIKRGLSGEKLRTGIKVALIGAPNVGKSSLINVLLKEDRAIVSAEAGTTRDIIEARLNIGGAPVTIYDTAGIRKAQNKIELEGVKRTKKVAKTADLILHVSSIEKGIKDEFIQELKHKNTKIIKVANKIDLKKTNPSLDQSEIHISCKTKQGIDVLLKTIEKEVKELIASNDMTLGPTRIRHIAHLKETKESLERALKESNKKNMDISADFVRAASVSLGRIIGSVDIEDVLDELFSGFCIGK